jgi:tellurite resistance protein TehA-like permease
MTLYSPPPPLHIADQDKPTLLVCWWITLFCATVIFLRVVGRFVRSEKLFREDRTVMFAVIPLFVRMGLVHIVLLWGTNNARFTWPLTEQEKHHKSIASGLVLASRMFYAAT